jgi:soluble lytic murein transglycosylase-like protein
MSRLYVLVCTSVLSTVLMANDYPYRGCFDIASTRHNIDLDLLLAVASVESNWDADARSNANAHGVMQIRWPLTARHLGAGRVAELYNPCLNIDLGARYMSELAKSYKGDTRLMLAAYNYGPSRIHKFSDIPVSVQRYIDKVNKKRMRISADMQADTPATLKGDNSIEVMRFDNASRARRYLAALEKRAPKAEFRIAESSSGMSVVYLDPKGLDSDTRYRLSALLPQLKSGE